MRTNKVVVLRVTSELHEKIANEAKTEKITIAEKARRYLKKGMEKESVNS